MPSELTATVGEVLARAFNLDTTGARDLAATALTQADADNRAALVAATSFADYMDARFADAVVTARRAVVLAAGAGPSAQVLAATTLALALANEPRVDEAPHLTAFHAARDGLEALDAMPAQLRSLTLALMVEAAFANGQLADAGRLLSLVDQRPGSPVAWLATLQPVRWALFGGDLVTARTLCERALAARPAGQPVQIRALFHAFLAMVAAYQDDGGTLIRGVDSVRELIEVPQRWPESGAYLVAGYALAAAGQSEQAAGLVLLGGGGPELHLAQVVDRTLGYDILVAAALDAGDLTAAAAWAERAHQLYLVPAAAPAVEQIDARLARARGDTDEAALKAAAAAARARAAGRLLEATTTDVEYARAMVDAGHLHGAVTRFNSAAHEAEQTGALALRSRAARELRRLGRRVEPRRGAGVHVLSDRELEVASMAAEGFTSRVIAQVLSLSERTVQGHLRRAMKALDVGSRAALPAALAAMTAAPPPSLPPLTARQAEVADHVRAGLSNAEIAAAMGISVKTVEKHVAMIFDRWGVSSRTAVARLAPTRPD